MEQNHKSWRGSISVSYTHLDVYKRQFYNSLIAQHRWKVMKHCTHIIAAFEEAVYDEKKKNMDVRLDDGEMNVDSLDSTEYSTESVQEDILYIAA